MPKRVVDYKIKCHYPDGLGGTVVKVAYYEGADALVDGETQYQRSRKLSEETLTFKGTDTDKMRKALSVRLKARHGAVGSPIAQQTASADDETTYASAFL